MYFCAMQIIRVNNRKTVKDFHKVPHFIYKDDPFWVCPLEHEVESIFNPMENSFFKHGEAIRWVLKNDSGELTGRVAAFINRNKAFKFQQPTGGMGFFECINDRDAAFLLFDTCREWLSERGMEAMDGPVNFGENDVNWGLLVEGFIHPGIGMNYNPAYYRELFESYGFKFYFEQVSNHLDLTKPFPERFWKIADWVLKKPEFTFFHYDHRNQDKYIRDMKDIYDTAWAFHESFTPLDEHVIRKTLEKSKPIIDEEMIWFAYYNDDPVAFLIMFPDINQILKKLNGKLHFWNKLKFLYLKSRKTITRARIIIMGVKPKFQRHGVESGIFWHLNEKMKKKPHFTELELSWVGDFNPKMRALHESVGAVFGKRHITYRKLFSDSKEFQRSVIIPVDTKEKAIRQNK
jgi:hypothetical protein